MKVSIPPSLGSLLAASLCAWSFPCAAQVVVSDATSYAGTVTKYEPVGQTLIVRQEGAPTPVTYSVTQATTFVDESGAPLTAEHITSGVPIVVHYVRQGDRMTADRVVVKRVVRVPAPAPPQVTTEKTTTVTTTTGAGTITQFSAGSPNIVLRSEAAEPLTYAVSKTTTYVDENGTPIAVERISPGLPVTVHYVQEGDRMIASRVVVVREPKRKLSEDEREALEDLREAQRERKKDIKNDNDDD